MTFYQVRFSTTVPLEGIIETEAVYISQDVSKERAKCFSQTDLPLRTRSLVFRYRLSRPAAARRRRKRKVFLITPSKQKETDAGIGW